jgi:hypothetical protein
VSSDSSEHSRRGASIDASPAADPKQASFDSRMLDEQLSRTVSAIVSFDDFQTAGENGYRSVGFDAANGHDMCTSQRRRQGDRCVESTDGVKRHAEYVRDISPYYRWFDVTDAGSVEEHFELGYGRAG